MDREVLLIVLVLFLCGPTLLTCGLLALPAAHGGQARELERRSWRRLWLPLLPAALFLAALVGWALQEPDASDEAVRPLVYGVTIPFAAIWVRAWVRALRALFAKVTAPAATVGLLRPRIHVAPELGQKLDPLALRAVVEHEAAHARHRDPLRIFLARLATDLQWPSPRAPARLRTWRQALELARDEEACAQGVAGADLAAALLEVARSHAPASTTAGAALLDDAAAFRDRVLRLLDARSPAAAAPTSGWTAWILVAAVLAAAVVLGAVYGDDLVRSLPGVLS